MSENDDCLTFNNDETFYLVESDDGYRVYKDLAKLSVYVFDEVDDFESIKVLSFKYGDPNGSLEKRQFSGGQVGFITISQKYRDSKD